MNVFEAKAFTIKHVNLSRWGTDGAGQDAMGRRFEIWGLLDGDM